MKIENKSSIAIIMATYNGALYLKEQIESILNQSYTDWDLYIQDDGSNDGTFEIVDQYATQYENIHHVDVGLSRQGACGNFMTLLNMVESNYYMLSDQDDVWLSHKIALSFDRIRALEDSDSSKPIIVHTDVSIVNEKLELIQKSKFNRRNCSEQKNRHYIETISQYHFLMVSMVVQGCTMMFNQATKNISYSYLNIRVQDSNIALNVAKSSNGIISAIYEPTMLYRIHQNNTCGLRDDSLVTKIKHFKTVLSENIKGFYIWKLYGGGSFIKWLYFRIRYFYLYRTH